MSERIKSKASASNRPEARLIVQASRVDREHAQEVANQQEERRQRKCDTGPERPGPVPEHGPADPQQRQAKPKNTSPQVERQLVRLGHLDQTQAEQARSRSSAGQDRQAETDRKESGKSNLLRRTGLEENRLKEAMMTGLDRFSRKIAVQVFGLPPRPCRTAASAPSRDTSGRSPQRPVDPPVEVPRRNRQLLAELQEDFRECLPPPEASRSAWRRKSPRGRRRQMRPRPPRAMPLGLLRLPGWSADDHARDCQVDLGARTAWPGRNPQHWRPPFELQ